MLGRLSDVYKHDFIEYAAGYSMLIGAIFLIGYLTYKKKWKWLWKEYITSLDPKKIGMMYLVVAMLSLVKGLVDALMMRAQQVLSVGESHGYLASDHFQQLFTAHGTTMIFFVGMGIIFALMNLIVPLQIGARDVAFPFLNAVSFYLYAVGAGLVVLSLVVGEFSGTGWVCYPPLSGLAYNPGVGVDYWIWSVQIAGIGSLLSGLNFFVTIVKMRCPGMTLMKMPIFIWSVLGTLVLILFAFPILTATIGMLTLDRYLDMHFFTPDFGGNPMMYINLIWAWGHPEVYILVLPAFGVFSEIVAVFSQKRLFGYVSMVWALAAITFLSFIVWLHHFFTMGASANANAFFGIMTMLIAVPTGVKLFNWLFTMHRGRVLFTTPMLWFLGFVFIFVIGGMTGVLMSAAPADYQVHNSLFLIAHFHSTIIGAVVFAFFCGLTYWFPKIFGYKLNERLGRYAFWCWMIGFLLAFMPLYFLGLMGATRRLDHYDATTGWQPLFIVAAAGVILISIGFFFQVLQVIVSYRQRKENLDTTGDPWNGRTLEWSIPSPPPEYNFAVIPHVHDIDAFWSMKHERTKHKPPSEVIWEDILMPKNTPLAALIGGFSFLMGFCLIWHIMWLAGLSLAGVIICMVIRLAEKNTEHLISAKEVQRST